MRTLYISDLDGTLLDNDARLSVRSARMISDLSRKGAMITFATARTPATLVPILDGVEVNLPAIVMTGAAMFNIGSLTYSNANPLRPDQVRTVVEVCALFDITPFIYILRRSIGLIDAYHAASQLNNAESVFVGQRSHLKLKHFHLDNPDALQTLDEDSCVILAFAMGSLERAQATAEALRERLDCSVTCYQDTYMPDTGLIDIFRPGVSKAAAVKLLREKTNADRVVVFGDNLNDLSMMDVADTSVAVANAVEEVRRRADVVIGANIDDAVARFIAYDYMKNEH